jgi:iron complex transport system permease protein
LLAFAVGGALSLTGAILQGIYRNPLVEPYTLGISGGAALGVALVIVLGIYVERGAFMLPTGGFGGALLSLILVYLLSFRRGSVNINQMLLIGVMVSFVASASMMLLMAVTTSENIHSIIFWIMGSMDEPNTTLIRTTLIVSLSGLLVTFFFARPLNALRLGEVKARNLGVNTNRTVRALFLIASILTGVCVSVAGVIGFVGLIIPHIIRLFMGSDYRFMLLGSFLGGSFFLIVCDILARSIIAPNELPIGVITGILGGVVFIVMLSKVKVAGK